MSIEEQIDQAIQDWSVSGDAMRWTPEAPTGYGGADFNYVVIDETHIWDEPAVARVDRMVAHWLTHEARARWRLPRLTP